MVQIFVVGIGAGAAAALLYASAFSGAGLAAILIYFLPLPVVIAALGFSHWAALIAAASGALLLAAVSNVTHTIIFLVAIGLPAWWLGYLALLARPVATNGTQDVEWYPIGRLVLWTAGICTLAAASALPFLGMDEETFRSTFRKLLEEWLRAQMRTSAEAPLQIPGIRNLDLFLDILTRTVLPAAAVSMTIVHTLNLWLGARIVKISNRLARPWPDIPSMQFPVHALALFAGAMVGCFVPGLIGMVSVIFVSCLVMAFAFLGFTVVHYVTRGFGSRTTLLVGFYVAIVLLSYPVSWPFLLLGLVGLIDTAFDLRRRLATKSGPPAPRT